MTSNRISRNIKFYVIISLIFLGIITIYAIATKLWVLTAIPIGFLFGFFLQKGDLCGSSAFSEVVLMRDWRKMWGLWICIVTGMAGFALFDLLGWITLNPKPFIWVNYVLGGVLFGVGMVLAGGCVSGCLFKAGTGNLNSMVALLGIGLGISLVEHGPLKTIFSELKKVVIKSAEGGPLTLSSFTDLPFWILALMITLVTVVVAFILKRKFPQVETVNSHKSSFLTHSWKPWQAGLMIGLLGCVAYLSSSASGRNYPLGVTHGVLHAKLLITDQNLQHVYSKQPAALKQEVKIEGTQKPVNTSGKKVSWWLILLVSSLVVGSWVSGRLSGEAHLRPKPPEQVITAFFGGFLVGTGAALAVGCVIGNIISGWALMSFGAILFGVVVVLTNWVTTYFYLKGGHL